ncbi:helix-turn-helix domain-containing protein [Arthrobacter sp. GMC3]|uniref:helix-turn-helix domain-containing protein n=1 Tax=Arthrobacter sp. GMC3 TaxID=2058894 RepID=UPI0034CD04D7
MWHAKVTQVEMARRLQITQGAISRKLRGERAFSSDELLAVSKMFNVPIGVLFGEKEKAPADTPGLSSGGLHPELNWRPSHYE